VIEGPKAGWLSAEIIALFLLAAGALTAFIRCERRSADPMMDLTLFTDRTYRLAIGTIFAVLFAVYGMLLVTTQYLQNVRGFSPIDTGLLLLPYSATATIVSLKVGGLVGRIGARPPILFGLVSLMVGLVVMALGVQAGTVVLSIGLVFTALGCSLCMTPTTSLAMTAVPRERAGMASGIMSAQRAIGSTVGFAVLGSILAAWLGATLDRDLSAVLPEVSQRRDVAAKIVESANPRAYAAEIGPGRPIPAATDAIRAAILTAANADFIRGIQVALATAIALLSIVLAAGYAGFPRGAAAMSDVQHEATKLAAGEAKRETGASLDV
jgi:MFS family permease